MKNYFIYLLLVGCAITLLQAFNDDHVLRKEDKYITEGENRIASQKQGPFLNAKAKVSNAAKNEIFMQRRLDILKDNVEYVIAGVVRPKSKRISSEDIFALPLGFCNVCSKTFLKGDIVVVIQMRIYFGNYSMPTRQHEGRFKDPLHSLYEVHAACPMYKIVFDGKLFNRHEFYVYEPNFDSLQNMNYLGSSVCAALNERANSVKKKHADQRPIESILDALLLDFENNMTHPAHFPCQTCAKTAAVITDFAASVKFETIAEMLRTMRISQFKVLGCILMKLCVHKVLPLFYRNVNLEILDTYSSKVLHFKFDTSRFFAMYLDEQHFDELLPLKMNFLTKFIGEFCILVDDEQQEAALSSFFTWRKKYTEKLPLLSPRARKENVELAMALNVIFLTFTGTKYIGDFLLSQSRQDLKAYLCDHRFDLFQHYSLIKHTTDSKKRIFILQTLLNEPEEKSQYYNFDFFVAELPVDAFNYDKVLADKSSNKARMLIEAALKRKSKRETVECIENVLKHFKGADSQKNLNDLKENLGILSLKIIQRLGINI